MWPGVLLPYSYQWPGSVPLLFSGFDCWLLINCRPPLPPLCILCLMYCTHITFLSHYAACQWVGRQIAKCCAPCCGKMEGEKDGDFQENGQDHPGPKEGGETMQEGRQGTCHIWLWLIWMRVSWLVLEQQPAISLML